MEDDEIAFDMHGEDISTICGIKLRALQRQVPKSSMQDVPLELKESHKNVRLFIDIFRFNILISCAPFTRH